MGKQTVEEGRAAAIIAEDKERFFDGMIFIGREEYLIQAEADPGKDRDGNPDYIKKGEEDKAFFCEASRRIGGFNKGAIGHTPEKTKIVDHKSGLFSYFFKKFLLFIAGGFYQVRAN